MRATRIAILLALVSGGGCAYYNGLYNARDAEERAESALRRGRTADARAHFAAAAEKADTVLTRYPANRWRTEALRLSGRGWALAGDCERGVPRLREYLATGVADERRDRATVALGACLAEQGATREARALLEPIAASGRDVVSREAARWAGRAALADGDHAAAVELLRGADPALAQWDLAAAAVKAELWQEAESLLVLRAHAGDHRAEAEPLLHAMWQSGQVERIDRVVSAYAASAMSSVGRARLHLWIGERLDASGDFARALTHFSAAERSAPDSLPGREALGHALAIQMRSVERMEEVEQVLARGRTRAASAASFQRLDDQVLLMRILASRNDYTGASLFLAAEVARDSLAAPRLAYSLFQRAAVAVTGAPVAPKALIAAAGVIPDSADMLRDRLAAEHASSPVVATAIGGDGSDTVRAAAAERQLAEAWVNVQRVVADSLTRRRAARASSAATAITPTRP